MKIKKIGIAAAAFALVAAVALPGCSSQPAGSSSSSASDASNAGSAEVALVNDGKLTVAASLDFPPFENLEGEEAVGFEVDLVKALAEQMGLQAEYLPSTKFDTIIPLISAGGKADIGVSGFTVTEDRKKEIDFTDVLIDSNQGVVVMPNSGYTSVDDLAGKTIATQSGTTGYDWAVENIPGANVVPYDEMTAVFAALQGSQADAIVSDLPVVQYYVKNSYTDMQIIEEIPTGEQYAIVVSKENPALTDKLNEALAELKTNGVYDEIYNKWFGASAE
ncbi:ABC transporter substrate-binding protein [Adlercreutzia sp. ZJ154]|uniref:ABC transporter substrate-binding protein n=1 Tax=Adlercreutzia sp. ZJ154 TaxID=2709790 RepID=UPI0013EB0960|nr:ABC transporter substrate-binding protein [Adlercreutzia sp. ZJ154]